MIKGAFNNIINNYDYLHSKILLAVDKQLKVSKSKTG